MVIGKLGRTDIIYEKILDTHALNSTDSSSGKAAFEELVNFPPLYLDYRAKILAEKKLGYYKDSNLVAEYNSHITQAAYSYWLEKEIKPSAFDELKQRSELGLKAFQFVNEDGIVDNLTSAIDSFWVSSDSASTFFLNPLTNWVK